METIRFLLSKLVIVIIVLAIAAFLYWMASLLVPFLPKSLSLSRFSHASSTDAEDLEFWLPTPRNVKDLGVGQSEYPYGRPVTKDDFLQYDGSSSSVQWNTPEWPTSNGKPVLALDYYRASSVQVFNSANAGFSRSVPSVRALNISAGFRVFPGLIFYGEATADMFTNGKFPIYVINPNGQIVGGGEARMNSPAETSTYRKFTARILTPIGFTGAQCTLGFQQATPNGIRIILPIHCN